MKDKSAAEAGIFGIDDQAWHDTKTHKTDTNRGVQKQVSTLNPSWNFFEPRVSVSVATLCYVETTKLAGRCDKHSSKAKHVGFRELMQAGCIGPQLLVTRHRFNMFPDGAVDNS